MSPEHDGKLFSSDCAKAFPTPLQRDYYDRWSKLPGLSWTGEPLFPSTLSSDELKVAKGEFKAIPELFYSTFSWLPVITPDNAKEFVKTMKTHSQKFGNHFMLWSWCSGSSRLLTTMASLPFISKVLFPVDLRYGWDLNHKPHRELLSWID